MVTGVACGLQNRYGAFTRPGWVRFPHVPATLRTGIASLFGGLLLLAAPPALVAQDPEPPPTVVVVQDSATARPDTLPPVSALGAFGRSMVLPGWGQVAVGRPERGAIYFGAFSASLYMVFKSQSKLTAARRIVPENEALVDSRKRQRENWIVLTVFVAFLSGLDAWVSTHFWDFEATIDAPPDGTAGAAIGLKVGVP